MIEEIRRHVIGEIGGREKPMNVLSEEVSAAIRKGALYVGIDKIKENLQLLSGDNTAGAYGELGDLKTFPNNYFDQIWIGNVLGQNKPDAILPAFNQLRDDFSHLVVPTVNDDAIVQGFKAKFRKVASPIYGREAVVFAELRRVLKPGGKIHILETITPAFARLTLDLPFGEYGFLAEPFITKEELLGFLKARGLPKSIYDDAMVRNNERAPEDREVNLPFALTLTRV